MNFTFNFQGEPVRLEFATKTTLKEVPDPNDFSKSVGNYKIVIKQ